MLSDTGAIDGIVATQDERTMAMLAHVLQVIGGWLAPLIILLVKRDSRFVSFHALQAQLFHLLYLFFSMLVMGGVFAAVAVFALHQPATQHASPPAFIFFFVPVWLGMMGWWVLMLMAAIVYGIKAGRGEWAEYPVFGRLARKILAIGPGGAPLL
jgi:uncharacterized protein